MVGNSFRSLTSFAAGKSAMSFDVEKSATAPVAVGVGDCSIAPVAVAVGDCSIAPVAVAVGVGDCFDPVFVGLNRERMVCGVWCVFLCMFVWSDTIGTST